MALLAGRGLVGLLVLAFWVWAVFDVIASDDTLIRNLPKMVWLMVVIFLSALGALAWLLIGRPENAGWRPGDTRVRPVRRTYGPEDLWGSPAGGHVGDGETERLERERRERYRSLDAELDERLAEKAAEEKRLAEWEEKLRRREEDLRRREQSGEDPQPSGED